MAVAVTNETMVLNTVNALTFDAATSSVVDTAEAFTITLAGFGNRMLILMDNVATDQGTVTYSIAAGGHVQAVSALTGSVAQGVMSGIVLETGKYLSASGTIVITFTPASGKRLLTDHAFQLCAVDMP